MQLDQVENKVYDKRISMRLKDKIYKSVMGPTMLYDSVYWTVDRKIELKIGVAEINGDQIDEWSDEKINDKKCIRGKMILIMDKIR